MIELSMPDLFYKNIKEMVYEPNKFLNKQTAKMIKQIVKIDKTKWPALEKMKNDWKRGGEK